jgi:hypothetical protein
LTRDSPQTGRVPRVSIGLPVFNGEAYVEEAIRSVLTQTLADFELIISDNASTDRTGEICVDCAADDPRICYSRNQKNIGGARNLNLVWERSSSPYFKWLAHDDRLLPGYLAATLAALEAVPEAVLCNSVVEYIDEHGRHQGIYRSVMRHCSGGDAAQRLAPLVLQAHTCVDVFGLIRADALQDSLLHQPFRGSDRALLAQLALRGPLLQLVEPLVQMRQHAGQYSQMRNVRHQVAWYAPDRRGETELSVLKLYRAYEELISTEPLSETQRAACQKVLKRFWLQGWTLGRLIAELLSVPFPRASSLIRAAAIKLRLIGAPRDSLE